VKKSSARRPDDTVMESPSLAITSPTTTNADRTEDQLLAAILQESGWQPAPVERVLFPWAFRKTRLRRTAQRARLAAQPASPPERTKP
jgi:hypothetical protein